MREGRGRDEGGARESDLDQRGEDDLMRRKKRGER